MIVFILAAFIGGFFLGASVGKDKAEKEFARYLEENDSSKKKNLNLKYSHTDFSSYYYNVYVPFDQFRQTYEDYLQHLYSSQKQLDQHSQTVDMRDFTIKIRKQLENTSAPSTSPLLQKSHKEYIEAAKKYEAGMRKLLETENITTEQVTKLLGSLPEFKQGDKHWLRGQTLFYESVILWESLYVTKDRPVLLENAEQFSMTQWKALRFHQKSELVAKLLEAKGITSSYNPEDVVVYLNTLSSSNTKRINKVSDAIDILSSSGSIRQGEFIRQIEDFSSLTSPMIPLYSK